MSGGRWRQRMLTVGNDREERACRMTASLGGAALGVSGALGEARGAKESNMRALRSKNGRGTVANHHTRLQQ